MSKNIDKITEKLSPLERKIVPYLNHKIEHIKEKTALNEVSIIHTLKFLENKGILKLKKETKQIIDLGTNGIYYKKNHLPERKLIITLEQKNHLSFEEAQKLTKLSDNEFKAEIGALRDKALMQIKNGKLVLEARKEELVKKTLEEQFIDALPLEKDKLKPEQLHAFESLKNRKDIVEVKDVSTISFELTEIGKEIAGKEISSELIEEITPEIIKDWHKKQKFRAYDIKANVPSITGGKKNFVNQSIEYAKRIWLDLGFKEMTGKKTVTSFWNFDALFTAQDHPVREMHDTFFIKDAEGKLPTDKELIKKVKEAHETGLGGSKGWRYKWNEETAKKVLIRTHTTILSAQTLAKLKKEDYPAKYFAVGKCFRNETVDWSHGFEFNQTEGIVIDPNANLRNLIGYLKEFAKKMGFEKIKIQPSYFPYTEPSLEGLVWNEQKKQWVEVLAAGIFRPEVTIPLLGTAIPVLAWGPGFDRLMMAVYKLTDMRQLYANDLKLLRNIPTWSK
jgi:phenylalanyl-tRNA synthetase alpha chain